MAQGDAQAMNNLGTLYNDGRGVARDRRLAKQWFKKGNRTRRARSQAKSEGHVAQVFRVYRSAQPSTIASVPNIIVTAITTRMVSRVIIISMISWRTG